MNPEQQGFEMTPELRREFDAAKANYDQLPDMDLDADLDSLAEKHAADFKRRGINYPEDGSVEERWLALRIATRKTEEEGRLIKLLDEVSLFRDRLRSAKSTDEYVDALSSDKAPDLDEVEKTIAAAADKDPSVKDLAEQVRSVVANLRDLTA